jgi:RNA polymerase sigma-70 factor (ECF subfamily)
LENGARRARPRLERLGGEELVRLVGAAAAGDKEAYGRLVERFRSVVMASIYSAVRRREVAEDLAQECFIKAYGALGELREPERFAGWLRTIAAHTAADWLRSRRSEVNLDKLAEAGAEPCAPADRLGGAIEDAEEEDAVLGALSELRDDYREIVVLKHLENYSYREIAEMLGMSVTGVGEKLSRVRSMLKKKLKGRLLD